LPKAEPVIATIHLFEEVDALLLDLLVSLAPGDWARPTIAGSWTVRDVVAHLLDTPLRRLSFVRDGWPPRDVTIGSDADLLAFVDAANAEGVRVLGRLSPRLLIELMRLATRDLREHLAATAPDAPAAFPVSWAGETSSPHWFDVAREYTERWHHQAQIRLALGALAPLMSTRLYAPVIATFVQALPHACRAVDAPEGTTAAVLVEGEGGGRWRLTRTRAGWQLSESAPAVARLADARDGEEVRIPAAVAWRLFTKGLAADAVARECRVMGRLLVGDAILGARAIVG
jgi:uncharacterized protein (TIGR03083 family)